MAITFIDLENAYATIPRDMTMGTLGWMGVPEALIPLLFIAVVDLISRKMCTKVILRKLLYTGGLAIEADGEANLQEQLIEWKDIFSRHGLRVRLERTEVMWMEHRKREQYIILVVKKLKERDSFVYLGGAICGVDSWPISKRKTFACGFDVSVGVHLTQGKGNFLYSAVSIPQKMCELIKYHPFVGTVNPML